MHQRDQQTIKDLQTDISQLHRRNTSLTSSNTDLKARNDHLTRVLLASNLRDPKTGRLLPKGVIPESFA